MRKAGVGPHPPWLSESDSPPVHDDFYPISGHAPVDDAADTFSPYSYRYIDKKYEPKSSPNGGLYLGIMAQNAQEHPLSAQVVQPGPDGLRLEGPALLSILSAFAGRHHDRINKHEQFLSEHDKLIDDQDKRLAAIERILDRR